MDKSGKFRLTSLERNWIMYDVGNSAFVLMVATLIPIFFNALAEAGGLSSVEYLAYWGYASSAVTVITAVLSPILGTVADTKGFKKPIFILCVFVGIVGCCAMGAASAWLPFLVIFVIAKVGFSGSLVFYDSMLGDVTTPERMDGRNIYEICDYNVPMKFHWERRLTRECWCRFAITAFTMTPIIPNCMW